MHAACDKLKETINFYLTHLARTELLWTSMVKNPLSDIHKMLGDVDREYGALLSSRDARKMTVYIREFRRHLSLAQGIDSKTGQPKTVREHVGHMTRQAVEIKVRLENGLEAKLQDAIKMSQLLPIWKQAIEIHALWDKLREFITGAKGAPDDNFWGHVERQCRLNEPKISIAGVSFLDNNGRAGTLEVYIDELRHSVSDVRPCVELKRVEEIEEIVQEVVTHAQDVAVALAGIIEDWFLSPSG